MSKPRARKIAYYGFARGTAEGLLAVRGILLAAILGPSSFGVWTLFRIAGRYLGLAESTLRPGLEYEASTAAVDGGGADVKEMRQRASHLGRVAAGFLTVFYGATGLLALTASFVVEDRQTVIVLRALGLTILAERLWFYGLAYMRSTGGLRRFGIVEVLGAALHLALAAALAIRFGLTGALVGFGLAAFASLGLLRSHAPLRPAFSRETLMRMLRIGAPLGLTLAFTLGLRTVDRLVVAAYGGTLLLGYYSLARSVAAIAVSGAWVVRTVVFPDVYRHADDIGAASATSNLIEDTILPFTLAYSMLLGLISFSFGPIIDFALPEYASAVEPARILVFVGSAALLSDLGSVGLITVSRHRVLPILAAIAFGLNLALAAWLLHRGYGIIAVAASALVSQAVYGGAVLWVAAAASRPSEVAGLVWQALWPLAYCLTLVIVLGRALPAADLRSALLAAAVYVVMVSPLLAVGSRRRRAS